MNAPNVVYKLDRQPEQTGQIKAKLTVRDSSV